jgi:hypothetical protein
MNEELNLDFCVFLFIFIIYSNFNFSILGVHGHP